MAGKACSFEISSSTSWVLREGSAESMHGAAFSLAPCHTRQQWPTHPASCLLLLCFPGAVEVWSTTCALHSLSFTLTCTTCQRNLPEESLTERKAPSLPAFPQPQTQKKDIQPTLGFCPLTSPIFLQVRKQSERQTSRTMQSKLG